MVQQLKSTKALLLTAALLSIGAPQGAQAKHRDTSDVISAVTGWLAVGAADDHPVIQPSSIVTLSDSLEEYALVISLRPSGFAIAGTDDDLLPVYLYAPNGVYAESEPALKPIIGEIRERHAHAMAQAQKQNSAERVALLQERHMLWEQLIAGSFAGKASEVSKATPSMMALKLSSEWDQHWPYDALAPLGHDGIRCVAGCGAIATAQVMYYWKWPPTGVSSMSYTWGGDPCYENEPDQTIYANFADSYAWSEMRDNCYGGCTETEINALAELCYEVGVAIRTNWGTMTCGGSGSDLSNVLGALEGVFRYDNDIMFTGDSNMRDGLTDSVRWLMPILVRGCNDADECHLYVVYGYDMATDPNRKFLMNMGAYGLSDVWYTLDEDASFPNDNYTLRPIAPAEGVRFVQSWYSYPPGDGGPAAPYYPLDTALTSVEAGTRLILRAGDTYECGPLMTADRVLLTGENVLIIAQ